jgi:hypothetical protein
MKQIIATITKLTGIVTPVAFVVSVIHDVGYFWVIGWKFQGLAGLTDYLTGILEWLPIAAAGIGAYVLANLVILNTLPDTWMKRMRPAAIRDHSAKELLKILAAGSVFVIFAVLYYFFTNVSDTWVIGANICFIWLAIVRILSWRVDLNEKFGQLGSLAFLLGPMIVTSIFVWGMQRAYFDLAPGGEHYTLWRPGEGKDAGNVASQVKVLRIYQNGVLVRSDAEAKNQFFRWDQVKLLELHKLDIGDQPLACLHLGWNCGKQPRP